MMIRRRTLTVAVPKCALPGWIRVVSSLAGRYGQRQLVSLERSGRPFRWRCGECVHRRLCLGADQLGDFIASAGNANQSSITKWQDRGYSFATNASSLKSLPNDRRALGLFTQGNLSTWLDQYVRPQLAFRARADGLQVYRDALKLAADPITGARGSSNVMDQPGLINMTLKAIDSA